MGVLMFYQHNVAQNIHQTQVLLQLIRVLEKSVSDFVQISPTNSSDIPINLTLLCDTDNLGVILASTPVFSSIRSSSFCAFSLLLVPPKEMCGFSLPIFAF